MISTGATAAPRSQNRDLGAQFRAEARSLGHGLSACQLLPKRPLPRAYNRCETDLPIAGSARKETGMRDRRAILAVALLVCVGCQSRSNDPTRGASNEHPIPQAKPTGKVDSSTESKATQTGLGINWGVVAGKVDSSTESKATPQSLFTILGRDIAREREKG